MNKLNTQQIILASFWTFALLYLTLALIAAVKSYSPIPQADLWPGYMHFFAKINSGEISAWWSQHNEHRIILSRILFWIDIVIFKGNLVFLFIINYVLATITAAIFFCCAKDILQKDDSLTKQLISASILILIFTRIQKENFDWAFQSQFFFAHLFPLISFYLIYKSHNSDKNQNKLFALSCLAGVMSAGTMANGILALPLATILALILRIRWKLVVIPAVLSVIIIGLYFCGYHKPSSHGSLTEAVLHHPIDLTLYVLTYLGNPFYQSLHSQVCAQIAGAILVLNFIFLSYRLFKNPNRSSVALLLMTFILFVELTALGTGGGRSLFGTQQATASRYATPTIAAWIALLIIYSPAISTNLKKYSQYYALIFFVIPLTFLPKQLDALDSQAGELFERKISAVALELRVNDNKQLAQTCSSADYCLETSELAQQQNIAIFNDPLFKDVQQIIGTQEAEYPTDTCLGNIDEISQIEDDGRYLRIKGWLFDDQKSATPQTIRILDLSGEVVGYALSGDLRKEIKKRIGKKAALNSGFRGYFLVKALHDKVILKGLNPDCELEIPLPPLSEK